MLSLSDEPADTERKDIAMIRKMLAAVALASGLALLAPSAAFADGAAYSGTLYPGGRQCVNASGSSANAYGTSSFVAVDFTVLFRPDGTTGFNQIDAFRSTSINRSYARSRTGTFRLCAQNPTLFYSTDVYLSLSTS
jgi:hypothetical protein